MITDMNHQSLELPLLGWTIQYGRRQCLTTQWRLQVHCFTRMHDCNKDQVNFPQGVLCLLQSRSRSATLLPTLPSPRPCRRPGHDRGGRTLAHPAHFHTTSLSSVHLMTDIDMYNDYSQARPLRHTLTLCRHHCLLVTHCRARITTCRHLSG